MSLLMNTLRTVLAARRGQVGGLQEDARAALAVPDAGSGVAIAGPQGVAAWRLLGAQTGVQELEYGDIARPGVRHLFTREARRVLDIGCASGAVGAGLKQSIPGLWVWGCELNERAAQVAATRLDHVTTVPRERWGAADLALLGSVDTVLLLDVLEHMYNPWAELEFLAQRLPADAQVIVSLPNVGHRSVLESLAEGSFPYGASGILDITHVRFFTVDGMHALFEETGFRIDATWVLNTSPGVRPAQFPALLDAGKLKLTVDDAAEWDRLHTIQFGFSLSPRPRPAA
jgi:2-polyprenyl-3-methyl-5-hydroxy-6-metoxy-1,4-benzoquinol methylase